MEDTCSGGSYWTDSLDTCAVNCAWGSHYRKSGLAAAQCEAEASSRLEIVVAYAHASDTGDCWLYLETNTWDGTAGWTGGQTGSTGRIGCTYQPDSNFRCYLWGGDWSANCTACPAGTFSNVSGLSLCSSCQPGTFSSSPGATACELCPANTFAAAGSGNCSACPMAASSPAGSASAGDCLCDPGTFAQSGNCSECAAGRYSDRMGATVCSNCAPGTYQSEAGSTSCTACPGLPHASSPVESDAASDCICNAGYAGQADVAQCTACLPGKYKDAVGNSGCADCPANTYSEAVAADDSSTCLACQSGASSPEGSDKRSMCVCLTPVECPEPFHLPPYLCGYENCMCKPGTEQIWVDATTRSCQDCEAGKAKGTWGSSDACEDCAPGFFTPFGSYANTACTACTSGSYKASPGAGNCTECPAGSISLPGSTSDFACRCRATCKSKRSNSKYGAPIYECCPDVK
eukprot:Tamp_08429.p1 GENE.Tamp_08429~~Tamp_08429.p1  ORF type:complete len:461 (+),score=18.65 Tamp_08429:454-1836(+)